MGCFRLFHNCWRYLKPTMVGRRPYRQVLYFVVLNGAAAKFVAASAILVPGRYSRRKWGGVPIETDRRLLPFPY